MPHRFARPALAAALAAAAAASACAPITRSHGYVPEAAAPSEDIEPVKDSKSSVLAKFGNPSTTGVFDGDVWYYISSVSEQRGYRKAKNTDRTIVAVSFDDFGIVEGVETFDIADGRVVNYSGDKTPTRGREMTILEQVLGNVGAVPPGGFGGQDNLPGGAGGPRRE